MKKSLLSITLLIATATTAQTFFNGGLSTGATAKVGTVAPAGYTWSEAQNNTGNTTESNTNAGYGGTNSSATANFFIADDFTIPAGQTWQISAIDFFAYQTNYLGTTSPFTTVRVNIFSSDPSVAGATSVFGNDTTNRFTVGADALMYRIFNSLVPTTANAPGTTRKIWKTTAAAAVSLSAGTYWIKYQLQNIVQANAGFLPPVTIAGTRGLPSFNAKQNDAVAGTWAPLVDLGTSGASSVNMDMPFVITYTSNLSTNEVMQYDNRIQVYPNPVVDVFKINNPEKTSITSVEITDASGRLIRTMKSADEYNVGDLQTGQYYLKIKSKEITKITKLTKK